MSYKIAFDIACYAMKTRNSKNKYRLSQFMIDHLHRNILSYSRKNAQNEIISYYLGIIKVVDLNIQIIEDYILHFELSVKLCSRTHPRNCLLSELFRPPLTLDHDDIQQIIWSVIPASYSTDGIIPISSSACSIKINHPPMNIKLI